MRHLLYREHKYVSAAFNNLERVIAKADFREEEDLSKVTQNFEELVGMLMGHAAHEDNSFHTLLAQKGSSVHAGAEEDHIFLDKQILKIRECIEKIKAAADGEKVQKGYDLYLTYRKFVADNLIHLHEEETQILPELQRLYTDQELQQIEAKTYQAMTPDQMLHMMQVLFPEMNPSDKEAFLTDIHHLQPKKFEAIWKQIETTLSQKEQEMFSEKFGQTHQKV